MKRSYFLALAIVLLSFGSKAQVVPPINQHPVEKPALFNQLPEKFSCPESALQNLFTRDVNSKITAQLGNKLQLDGTVLEKMAVTPQQLSINIRCTNLQNALLNISRLVQPDGSYQYVGRIVSPQHGDVLLLWQDNGQYYFIKQKQLLTMVE